MKHRIQRSMLILPVNVPRFVQKAHLRGADAIVLDLEDAVPHSEKEDARKLVKHAVELSGLGGVDVLVRVNNEPQFIEADLDAAVHQGLHGIFVPKVESPTDVTSIENLLARLENKRGIDLGRIKLSVHIESPRGLLNIREIAAVGTRIESMSLGVDDYCLELGVEPSEDGTELFFPMSMMATTCKAARINPIGIQGSVAGFRDPAGFERASERSRSFGFTGGYCIHPDQVPILNRVFSPSPAKIDHARRVIFAFEEGLRNGRASVSLDNRMVDTPIYKQAKLCIERAEAIAALELRKSESLKKLGVGSKR